MLFFHHFEEIVIGLGHCQLGIIFPSILPLWVMNTFDISVTMYKKLVRIYIRHTFSSINFR